MGGRSYSHDRRANATLDFMNMNFNQQFTQQDKGEMHESMDPKGILLRECRDNEHNPETVPIGWGLDITGSMQTIPRMLIGNGLPDMIKKLQERGIKDPAILFMGLGDSKCDKAPFQVGQFECEDTLLDQWLRRTWIEGNGGGNNGESYLWAWWLFANKVQTDAWDKRGQKGFLITVGNEPCHTEISKTEFMKVLGHTEEEVTMQTLYDEVTKRWNVYHLCINNRDDSCPKWKEFLGSNAIEVNDYREIPNIAADLIANVLRVKKVDAVAPDEKEPAPIKKPKITL